MSAFDRDVSFSPEVSSVHDALDYDRRTIYKTESDKARNLQVAQLRVGICLAALIYAAIVHQDVEVGVRPLIKATPILLMIWLTIIIGDMKPYAIRVAIGLSFCAVGDVCLEMDRTAGSGKVPYFLIGLAAFLLGHCSFAFAFGINERRLTALTVFLPLIFCGGIFVVLRPSLPAGLIYPVLAYAVAIGGMTVLALSRNPGGYASEWSFRHGAVGAVLFTASDTILAYDRFVAPVPYARFSVMTTYYLAQYGIAVSARGAMPRPLSKALGSVENFNKGH